MQEVFENIINKLEEQKEYYKDIRKNTHCRVTETDNCDSCRADHCLDARLRCVDDITEIVKQEAEQYNNGWISCSERLPEERESMFAKLKGTEKWKDNMFEKISNEVNVTIEKKDGKLLTMYAHTVDGKWKNDMLRVYETWRVIAWQPLPAPYQPKGE